MLLPVLLIVIVWLCPPADVVALFWSPEPLSSEPAIFIVPAQPLSMATPCVCAPVEFDEAVCLCEGNSSTVYAVRLKMYTEMYGGIFS